MKLIAFFLALICLQNTPIYAQKKKTPEQLKLDTLKLKLSGVKYLQILSNDEWKKIVKQMMGNNSQTIDLQVLNGIYDYATKDLGLGFVFDDEQLKQSLGDVTSICDNVYFTYSIGPFKSDFMAIGKLPLEFNFTFCDNSQYYFKKIIPVNGTTNYRNAIRAALLSSVTNKQNSKNTPPYDKTKRLSIHTNPIVIEYNNFLNYLDTSKFLSQYEGLFELFYSSSNSPRLKLGIYNDNGVLKLVYFGGSYYSEDWKSGEMKGILTQTKSENNLLATIFNALKYEVNYAIKFINSNEFEMISTTSKSLDRYVRIK